MTHDDVPTPTDDQHVRPEGLDDVTVDALGKLSKGLETIERARGHLYAWHQLTGGADFELDAAVKLLRQAGHAKWADRVEQELIGRNVLEGRWTFQVMEEYDDGYYSAFRDTERDAREALAGGRRHVYEAELKMKRRTAGEPGHDVGP